MLLLLVISIAAIFLYSGIMVFRFTRLYLLVKTAKSFPTVYSSKKNTSQHILILGDSSMYGVGILDGNNTIGALLAAKYKKASIEVLAENGAKVTDLAKQFKKARYKKYTVILIGIGANDIMLFSNFETLQKNLIAFLQKASTVTNHIILCHSVNIGNVGFFLFPFTYIFDYRTRKLSYIYSEIEKQFPSIRYVNFYRKREDYFYNKANRKKFLARDGAHPNDYANQFFFNLIWKELIKIDK